MAKKKTKNLSTAERFKKKNQEQKEETMESASPTSANPDLPLPPLPEVSVSTRRQEDQSEKEKALDELFSKFPTSDPLIAAAAASQNQPATNIQPLSGTEIYSTFGGGSIVINGTETRLPVTITSPQEFQHLKNFYGIDSAASPLRSRRIGASE